MSYTNQTANYGLPQYSADDKPTYLGDFNKAMLDIDTAIKSADTKAEASETLAQNASNSATEALTTANSASTTAGNALTTANNAQTTATNAMNTATGADTKADTAISTANSADSKADTAISSATAADTKADTAISTANSADTKATQNATKIATLTPVVAYSNENPSSLAANDVLQCSVDLNDYDYIEIIFINAASQTLSIHSSGKCETSNSHYFGCSCFGTQTNASPWMRCRDFSINSDGNLVALQGHFIEFNGTGHGDNNDAIIPIQILAYKLPN